MHTLLVTALVAAVVAGAPAAAPVVGPVVAAGRPAPPPRVTMVTERFERFTPGAAVTYRADLVPAGARVSVVGLPVATSTTVVLGVAGLVPHRAYGAHVHVRGCGADPAAAGPHYQDRPDPRQPSTDPHYANPDNEIWLDLTTDDKGAATSSATVGWEFRKGEANAVVVHASHTHTEAGKAGTAGDRLACLTHAY